MTTIEWRDEFETGEETIDLQHRYFVALVNRLGRELSSTEEPSDRAALLHELHCYARFHFVSEENVLKKLAPEVVEPHRAIHNELLYTLNTRLQRGLDHPGDVESILSFVGKWLVEHTLDEDKVVVARALRIAAGAG